MKKRIFRSHPVWRSVVLAFAGLVLGTNIYVWNARSVVGNALPMPLGVGTAVVLSSSMEPTLEVNDWVIIRRTNQVDVGDVVVYQQGRDLIIHRLVAQDGEILYTQGDASKTMDEPVELSAVKGVMVGRVPYVGALIRFLKKPTGVALVLLAAIVVTEGSFRRQRARDEAQLEAIKADIRRLQRERK